jgi:sortase A
MIWVARGLIVTGVGLLMVQAGGAGLAAWHQRQLAAAIAASTATARGEAAEPATLREGDPIGILEVPRLGVSVAVVEGDTDAVLQRAVGHLPDTALPWEEGNSALAAHRDTYFRPLHHVEPGDLVRLTTVAGTFEYRVTETLVVDPHDLWVIDPTPERTLTLITCHPFTYVGPAPQRFIVRATDKGLPLP